MQVDANGCRCGARTDSGKPAAALTPLNGALAAELTMRLGGAQARVVHAPGQQSMTFPGGSQRL